VRAPSRRRCCNPADLEEIVQDTLRRRQHVSKYESTDPQLGETFSDSAANNEVEAGQSAGALKVNAHRASKAFRGWMRTREK
jgi:hypothetical protein